MISTQQVFYLKHLCLSAVLALQPIGCFEFFASDPIRASQMLEVESMRGESGNSQIEWTPSTILPVEVSWTSCALLMRSCWRGGEWAWFHMSVCVCVRVCVCAYMCIHACEREYVQVYMYVSQRIFHSLNP